MNWHQLSISEVAQRLNSNANGLQSDEVQSRLLKSGRNELIDSNNKYKLWRIFWNQFSDFMIIILIIAAIISGFASDLSDTIIILSIVFINALVGFVQEYRAEKALDSLKNLARSHARVFRDKKLVKIDSSELVAGDVIKLNSGDLIPADIRFISTNNLKVDESALTGESQNIEKNNLALKDPNLPIGDRTNMAFKGTFVTTGHATAYVVETGMNTELGHIAKLIQKKEQSTPLQKRLNSFGKSLSLIILGICIIIFLLGWLRGESLIDMLLLSISLAVAAIPEALPALVTISLAMGAKKLVKQHVLVRKLHAVETLGSVNFICTDKTGTLTLNKMSVEKVFEVEDSQCLPGISENLLLTAMALSNDISKNENGEWIGESTELSLFNFALSQNHDKHNLEKDFPRIAEIPFDAFRKCMTTLHQTTEGVLVISKGAVEMLIKTPGLQNIEKIVDLENQVNKLSKAGYRVLGYSYKLLKELPVEITPKYVESSLSLLGYAAIIDPPREDAKRAISQCKAAGITPVMITGDHKLTATAVAKALGIIIDDDDMVLSGAELAGIDEEQFSGLVEEVKVYARVDPEQKLRIVNALQSRGHFVAMTGDGVNDAPALKNADIGIAMGINGTEVSKEAAHMILLDDNFSSIVGAIKHGRQIFDNILKFIKYIMTGNSGEIWAIMLAPLLGLPIPLLPIHILWINLVTDGLPGLALASEAAEPNIMKRKPRKPSDSIFSRNIGWHILWVGLLMGLVTLAIQAWAINNVNPKAQTMAFTVLCFSQMGHALAIKSDKDSIFKSGLFSNKPMFFAILISILLQMMIIYIPALNKIFKTEALSFTELAFTIAASSIVFLTVEFEKKIRKRKTEL